MSTLALQRCQRHPQREAVARCPVCQGFFCRECVVEHDDTILCGACLANLSDAKETTRSRFAWLPGLMGAALGFLLLGFVFHTMGRALVSTPSSFHEGTIWKKTFLDNLDDSP